MARLTPRQQAFVNEYLVDLNATQAAIRAGYSQKTANEQGARLLANVSIQSFISEQIKKRNERTERTADDVLRDIQDWTREAHDKGDLKTAFRGLELEGKHLGMFKDKVDLTNSDGSLQKLSVNLSASPAVQDFIARLKGGPVCENDKETG